MKEIYQKPDAEYVSLIAKEELMTDVEGELGDGEMGMESSIF